MSLHSKKIAILYHANCADGFGAAWAAWKKFHDKADYIPVQHEDPLPASLAGKTIYTVDFTYPLPLTKELIAANERVTSIDHHISSKEATEATADHSYALEHSGAVLAWNYFHPKKPVPKLLRHIEDMDLWKFQLSHTKPILSYLATLETGFDVFNRFARQLENPVQRKKIISIGSIIGAYEQKLIDQIVRHNSVLVEFCGYKTLAANSPKFGSEIGHALYTKLPPIGLVWRQRDNQIVVSLRSDGSVDVSKIAASFGGGGHKAAASFRWPLEKPFPWKVISS